MGLIPFNKVSLTALEKAYTADALERKHLAGDGFYTKKVNAQLAQLFGLEQVLLCNSGTDALEFAALLANIAPGDEVIMPSFTFSSTANAFLRCGAKIVFADIRPDTQNIDENKIAPLITSRTKAIVPVHYAGVPCEMDSINALAQEHKLLVIEDAAQAVGSRYKGQYAGLLSDLGCYSFHETKNFAMGEGGALTTKAQADYERGLVIREKGTNRTQVLLGLADKYTWHDIGSSFLPSDLSAALLSAQLERYEEICHKRMAIWQAYAAQLSDLAPAGKAVLPVIPAHVEHNAHLFYLLLENEQVRQELIAFLRARDIVSYIHYVPLHSSPFGLKQGNKASDCPVTEDTGKRLLRLPLFTDLSKAEVDYICASVHDFFQR